MEVLNSNVEWITFPEYQRRTGISRKNLKKLLNEGKLTYVTSETGQYSIMMKKNDEIIALQEELHEQRVLIEKLCKHLGVG